MARRNPPAIPDALLDQLLDGADPRTAFNPNGVIDALRNALAERMLNAELDHHLGDVGAGGPVNTRNGYGQKTVLTDSGRLALDIPRDCQGTFDPQLIAKYQRRFPGFDEKIVSMYARGMSVREFQGHIRELYGIDVSPDLVSAVTDAVLEEVAVWQNRPLEPVHPAGTRQGGPLRRLRHRCQCRLDQPRPHQRHCGFAVESIRRWWHELGHARYPGGTQLLITADCGGSNGARVRLWKTELQTLADQTGLSITVAHHPPGTSKWNRIEHRLFAFITQNWRGKPLLTHQVIIQLIASTTTQTGLTVQCRLDENTYEKGAKVSDAQIAQP